MHTSTDFVLRGGSAAFADKEKLLFDQLLIAESKCNKRKNSNTEDIEVEREHERSSEKEVCRDDRKQKRETKRFRGKESIFNLPQGPAPRSRARYKSIPDYHKNPHKWTKYSLNDESNEDMTEDSNTQAAMSFLRELKARKKKEKIENKYQEEMDVEPCNSEQPETQFKSKKCTSTSEIVFKKPQIIQKTKNSEAVIVESDSKPIFKGSTIILPKYQIGQKPKKNCKQIRPIVKVDRSKEIKLDHLQQLEEEDE